MARTRDSAKYAHLGRNKNTIINGAFDVWQRGTSFAAIANASYSADRWRYGMIGAAVHTVSQSSDVPTVAEAGVLANYSLLVDCTTADASIAATDASLVSHRIEGYAWRNYAQRALTLSFWVKATKTGTYCIGLRNAGADQSYVAEYIVNATATWEKKVIHIPASPSAGTWNYTTGIGGDLIFAIAAGSNFHGTADTWNSANNFATANQVNGTDSTSNDFRLALVQLEVGDVATDFEIEAYDQTLQRCERYYHTGDSSDSSIQSFYATAGGQVFYTNIQFRCRMRTNPTVSISAGSMSNFSTPVVNAAGDTAFGWYVTSTGAGIGYAAVTYTASAEL